MEQAHSRTSLLKDLFLLCFRLLTLLKEQGVSTLGVSAVTLCILYVIISERFYRFLLNAFD